MRKTIIFTALVVIGSACFNCLISNSAYGLTVDGTISYASDPYSGESTGFKTTTGYGIGASQYLTDSSESVQIAARVDINYYKWSNSSRYLEWSFARLPVFGGLRICWKAGPMQLYGEGGLELSFDKRESFYTGPLYGILSPGQHNTYSDRSLGIIPGVGIEIPLFDNVLLGLNARYHLINNPYTTVGLSVGYRF